MSQFVVIYAGEDKDVEWPRMHFYQDEIQVEAALNDKDGYLGSLEILEEFPGSGCAVDVNIESMWPNNSMLIFKNGAIYVPKKIKIEQMIWVERWEID